MYELFSPTSSLILLLIIRALSPLYILKTKSLSHVFCPPLSRCNNFNKLICCQSPSTESPTLSDLSAGTIVCKNLQYSIKKRKNSRKNPLPPLSTSPFRRLIVNYSRLQSPSARPHLRHCLPPRLDGRLAPPPRPTCRYSPSTAPRSP